MSAAGKFDRNMEMVHALLKDLCANGPIEISNETIAAKCGFKTPRQVREYLRKLKAQGRVFARLDRVRFAGGWLNTRYLHIRSDIASAFFKASGPYAPQENSENNE